MRGDDPPVERDRAATEADLRDRRLVDMDHCGLGGNLDEDWRQYNYDKDTEGALLKI